MLYHRYKYLVKTYVIMGLTPYNYDPTTKLYEKSPKRVIITWIFKLILIIAILNKPKFSSVSLGAIADAIFYVESYSFGAMAIYMLLCFEKDFDIIIRIIYAFHQFDEILKVNMESKTEILSPNKVFICLWSLSCVLYIGMQLGDVFSYILVDTPYYNLNEYWYFLITSNLMMVCLPVFLTIEREFGEKFQETSLFLDKTTKNKLNLNEDCLRNIINIYVLLNNFRLEFHHRIELFMLVKFVHGYISGIGSLYYWLILDNSGSWTWMALVFTEILLITYLVERVNKQVMNVCLFCSVLLVASYTFSTTQ